MFTSNLFGSLGVGVFVGPNTIDFSTVFDNVGASILENLPVFVTVFLITLLYFPLVIICRKYDKKDELKVRPGLFLLSFQLNITVVHNISCIPHG